jgi:multicomponent Na+:H+ antiporter subunit B
MEILINILLFAIMVACAMAIAKIRHLFAVVMLSGAFSLLAALLFVTLDAVDVAFTEAAVGAGISTVLMLGTIALTVRREKPSYRSSFVPLLVVILTGAVLVYGTLDMPNFGDPNAVVHQHVGPEYIERIPKEVDVPNFVTAILASYRGFDTLGEVAVVFTAGIGVVLLLSGLGAKARRPKILAQNSDNNEASS